MTSTTQTFHHDIPAPRRFVAEANGLIQIGKIFQRPLDQILGGLVLGGGLVQNNLMGRSILFKSKIIYVALVLFMLPGGTLSGIESRRPNSFYQSRINPKNPCAQSVAGLVDRPPYFKTAMQLFDEYQLIEKREDKVKFLRTEGAILDLRQLAKEGILATQLTGNWGAMNEGIWRLGYPDGKVTIVKRFGPFLDDVTFYILGDLVPAAPRLINFGIDLTPTVDGQARTKEWAYVEMEELFPGQKKWELKVLNGFWHEADFPAELAVKILSKKNGHGRPVFQSLAEIELDLLEKDIIYFDRDFMISDSGEVRWVDLAFRKRGETKSDNPEYNSLGSLIDSIGSYEFRNQRYQILGRSTKRQYVDFHLSHIAALLALIKNSKHLSPQTKNTAEIKLLEYKREFLRRTK